MQSFRSLLRKPIANVAGGVLTKVSAPAIVSVMRNVQYGAVSSTYSQPVRSMSFFSDIKDKVTGKIAEKVEDNKEKTAQQGFEALKNMFLLTPVFRLEHYYMHLNLAKQQTESWKGKLAQQANIADMGQVLTFFKVLDAFTPEERRVNKGDGITSPTKVRVAAATQVSVEEINKLLKQFDVLCMMHKWLQQRAKEGKTLPNTMEECKSMMMMDGQSFVKPPKQRRR